MEINIEKYHIPVIWIDTHVIIKIAKIIVREKLSERDQTSYDLFYDALYEKVLGLKIICPRADQQEEIEHGQRLERECHRIQEQLSFGLQFKHRLEIERTQRIKTMEAYINKNETISFSYEDVFDEDPMEMIQEAKKNKLFVSAFMKPRRKQVESEKVSKIITCEQLEELRQNNIRERKTYEDQLQDEYQSIIQAGGWAINNCLSKMHNQIPLTCEDYCQLQIIEEPLEEWRQLNGQPENLPGLQGFINSEYYKRMPYVDIHAKLAAKIVTSSSNIQPGDAMDVNQLSTVIPYCNYIVTDKKMKNMLIEFGIDKKYNTKIY